MNKESASILTIVFSLNFFVVCICAPPLQADIPTEGLVSYWTLDEGAGLTVYDSAGSNDGTIHEALWIEGQLGGALEFDGVDDFVEIPDDDSLTPSHEITVSFWIYNHGGQVAGIYKIAFCPNEYNSPGNSRSYRLVVGKSTRQVYWEVFSSTSTYDQIVSNSSVPLNEWHHVAATFDHGEAATYIDGQLDKTKTLSVSSIMNDAQPLFIGGLWSYCDTDHWIPRLDGSIDEIAIYNRALPPEEIEQLYQDGAGGPIAHWKFDEGAGDIAYDSVGDNDGALVNGPSWTTGKVGGALEFDGVDEYVSLSSNAVTSTEFTVSGWANHYGPGGGVGESNFIFSQRDDPTGDNHSLIGLRADAAGYAGAGIRSSIGSHQKLRYPRKNYHEWHHYAMTVSTTDFVFYIDGAEVNRTSNNQQGDYVTSIDHVYIGRHVYSGQDRGYFNGLIDEVAVWNRALSGQEIEELYLAGVGEPRELVDLEITGPDEVADSNSAAYSAVAHYDNDSTADVTQEAVWSVEPDVFANIDNNGLLTTEQLYTLEEIVWISAQYTENEITVDAERQVVIFANCTTEELVRRNLSDAVQIKNGILEELETALAKEKAAEDLLRDMQQSREPGEWNFFQVVKARVKVLWAIIKQMWAKRKIEDSKDSLEDSLEILNSDDPQPAPPPNNGRRRRPGWQRHGR